MKYVTLLAALFACAAIAADTSDEPVFPATAELFVEGYFEGSEGLAFNGEGRLFVTANRALWEIHTDGTAHKIVDLFTNLGLAAIGERDLLVADFGPTNAFRQDRNTDGIVWRITPEGDKTELILGIGDPNFVLVREDGSILVSDDATSDIFVVGEDNNPKIFSTAVNHPNGLALSDDGKTLYVAQIFKSIRPVVRDDSLWAIDLVDGKPKGGARLVTRTGPLAANDGLAMDAKGRVYIAANGAAGQVWRYDPDSGETELIAEGVYGAASIAFGAGEFDHESIYVSTTTNQGRGGKIWRVAVGAKGQKLHR